MEKIGTRRWLFIHAEGHKVIWASPEVVEHVKDTLAKRNASISSEEEREAAWVDRPGMVLVDRNIWSINVDGLQIDIPASDFDSFLEQVRAHKDDAGFNGDNDASRKYRSVYGWLHVIAMTQGQYDALYEAMLDAAPAVRILAQEEEDRLLAGLRLANERLAQEGKAVQFKRFERLDQLMPGPSQPLGGKWN